MKLLYLSNIDLNLLTGVSKKINLQILTWKKLLPNIQIDYGIISISSNYRIIDNLKQLIRRNKNDYNNYELIYIRYGLNINTFVKLRKYKYVLEINSNDVFESIDLIKSEKKIKKKLFYCLFMLYNLIRRKIAINNAAGLIFVTYELSENKYFKKYNKPFIVIPNSISIEKGESLKEKYHCDKTKLFFIGTPGFSWHGIEKIFKLSDLLGDEFEFHLIGYKGKNSKRIKYYGYLANYNDIIKKFHIGIGTLSLHRKKSEEACPLKVREYIKNGFPIIIGYTDTALLGKTFEWVFQIENREDSIERIDIERLKYFLRNMKQYIISDKDKMIFDNIENEKKRLLFFKEIIYDK